MMDRRMDEEGMAYHGSGGMAGSKGIFKRFFWLCYSVYGFILKLATLKKLYISQINSHAFWFIDPGLGGSDCLPELVKLICDCWQELQNIFIEKTVFIFIIHFT